MDELKSGINSCTLIDLGMIHNISGNMTIIQNEELLPFNIKRIYYLYDVPGGSERGGHAHKALFQVIIAASGSFDVFLDDGILNKRVTLNRPNKGLIFGPGIWRELDNFSSGAICLVLASEKYDRADYIYSYTDFQNLKASR